MTNAECRMQVCGERHVAPANDIFVIRHSSFVIPKEGPVEDSKPAEMQLGYAKIDEAPKFDPAFYKLDELQVVNLREGVTARFILGGRMMMSFVHLAPGAEMPLHDHHHEQIGHMVEGTMYLT